MIYDWLGTAISTLLMYISSKINWSMNTCTHTHTPHTHTHTLTQTHTHTHTHAHTHSYTHPVHTPHTCTRTHTYTQEGMHVFPVTCLYTQTYIAYIRKFHQVQTDKHPFIYIKHTFAHTRTTHTAACTYTQTCALSFVTSPVPKRVTLLSLYNPGSINHVNHLSATYFLKKLCGIDIQAISNMVHSKETSLWLNHITIGILVHVNSGLLLERSECSSEPFVFGCSDPYPDLTELEFDWEKNKAWNKTIHDTVCVLRADCTTSR